jgi:hypothetical protein
VSGKSLLFRISSTVKQGAGPLQFVVTSIRTWGMDGVDHEGHSVDESPFDHGLSLALEQAADLIDSCLLALEAADVRVAYGIHLLRKAEKRIALLGSDKHLPDQTANALLAARDTLSAHLLARAMLTEVGAAPGVGRGILRRGAADCQAILDYIRQGQLRELVLGS